jgi:hypothetical protein
LSKEPGAITNIALQTLTLLTFVSAAVGHPTSVKAQYYKRENARVVEALVTWKDVVTLKRDETCHDCITVYNIKVLEAFKGCKSPDDLVVSSGINCALCGADLQVGTKYLLYIFADPIINLCQGAQPFSALSTSDLTFLKTRNVCCNGKCSCVPGTSKAQCIQAACNLRVKPPCSEATKCVGNYCGSCFAEWFKNDSSPACV